MRPAPRIPVSRVVALARPAPLQVSLPAWSASWDRILTALAFAIVLAGLLGM